MPASITLSDVAWSTPDGHPLLSGITLTFGPERVGLVGRNGVGKTTLLALMAGERTPRAGSVTVSGRLGVLHRAIGAEPGATIADRFGVTEGLARLRRAEEGRADAADLADADWTLEERIHAALAAVGLDAGPDTPLSALSGGQRTRASLAAVVFAAPDILLLDEPTNHLDIDSVTAVEAGLRAYDGALLVVSHDEAFLDALGVTRRLDLSARSP
ncbi:ATP-binding cassette domain-containing protein [Azospirillum halopraeferens]|uniref:ATP-binding cassette domain-containing protein n=1 Tax=Azospirillum halopraeferens TaxID=34010 RepID=UPI0003F96601|nr:ATP-binding cassette domain-containing protein [Azospirillum halopraeferens]